MLKVMKFCAWRCKKRMESYVIARPAGQIENGKHAKYSDKKAYLNFEEFFPVVDLVI